LAFIDIDQFLDSTYKLGGDRRILSLEFTTVLGLSKNTVRKCIKDLEDKGIITSFSETK
jgi:biotin operon repressor